MPGRLKAVYDCFRTTGPAKIYELYNNNPKLCKNKTLDWVDLYC